MLVNFPEQALVSVIHATMHRVDARYFKEEASQITNKLLVSKSRGGKRKTSTKYALLANMQPAQHRDILQDLARLAAEIQLCSPDVRSPRAQGWCICSTSFGNKLTESIHTVSGVT